MMTGCFLELVENPLWRVHMDGVGGKFAEQGQLQLSIKCDVFLLLQCRERRWSLGLCFLLPESLRVESKMSHWHLCFIQKMFKSLIRPDAVVTKIL